MHKTTIVIWSAIGHTPVTNRKGAYCDELVKVTEEFDLPEQAKSRTKQLIAETEHATNGHFDMPTYENQNIRSQFVR